MSMLLSQCGPLASAKTAGPILLKILKKLVFWARIDAKNGCSKNFQKSIQILTENRTIFQK